MTSWRNLAASDAWLIARCPAEVENALTRSICQGGSIPRIPRCLSTECNPVVSSGNNPLRPGMPHLGEQLLPNLDLQRLVQKGLQKFAVILQTGEGDILCRMGTIRSQDLLFPRRNGG